ncbi:hypothetical protein ACIBCA_36425 [Kitasatospora sp. NPDC051170]|uniref:hypothetical protein n=1 Tax=Kitasatospora sp. NPDC051170 TaxID=3364056 RepID=UPI00379F794A
MGTNHPGTGRITGALVQTGGTRTGQGPVVNRIENTVIVTGLLIQCGEPISVTGDEDTAPAHSPQPR